uniref:SFRICE_006551 n=1 Tax=Spodoptera frugiperda TaxID=7108 RepID=A0A2H1WDH3_SPOFR
MLLVFRVSIGGGDCLQSGLKSIPVNSASYLNEDASKVPVDERFLYDFLQKRRNAAEDSDDDDSDADSVNSEDFEQYLDSVTGAKALAESDDELDYLADMAATKQKRGNKKQDDDEDHQLGSDDDDDDEDGDEGAAGADDEDGDSDGELNISGDEDEPALSGEEDELLLEDSDDDDDKIDVPGTKSKKGKGKLKLKGGDDLGSLFASAEEFSTLLEETATNKKQGSSQAVANTDNASTKQLAWEDNRAQWIKGYNRKILGNKSNNKKFKNKKGNFNKSDNKSKPNKKGFNKMVDKGGKRKGAKVNGPGGKKKKMK